MCSVILGNNLVLAGRCVDDEGILVGWWLARRCSTQFCGEISLSSRDLIPARTEHQPSTAGGGTLPGHATQRRSKVGCSRNAQPDASRRSAAGTASTRSASQTRYRNPPVCVRHEKLCLTARSLCYRGCTFLRRVLVALPTAKHFITGIHPRRSLRLSPNASAEGGCGPGSDEHLHWRARTHQIAVTVDVVDATHRRPHLRPERFAERISCLFSGIQMMPVGGQQALSGVRSAS